jgi:type I restriction enzyme S subunit
MVYIELGKIAEFVRGPFGGSLKKNIFVVDGFAVYEQQHAIYNQFEQIRYFIDEKKFNEMKRFEVSPNDLLMSCSGTMGKVAIVPKGVKQGIINQALLKITPSNKLDSRFLEYYMKSNIFYNFLNADAKGAAIKNVASVKELKKIPVMVVSISQQQAIVTKLDEVFTAINQAKANIEKNIQNAKELFQSKLNQIFSKKGNGWEEDKLGGVVQFTNGRNQKEVLDENGTYPILGSAGNTMGYANNFLCEKGSVIIGRKGNISKPLFIDFKFWNVDTAFGLFPKNNLITPRFNYYLCLNIDFASHNKGTTIPSLVKSDLVQIQVTYPKRIETQKQIVTQLDQLQEQTNLLVTKYQQKLNNLEELKKSILEKAFKGELLK